MYDAIVGNNRRIMVFTESNCMQIDGPGIFMSNKTCVLYKVGSFVI